LPNDWLIDGNLIADFVKVRGDRTSYGAFVKGVGPGNRFMRNAVFREHRLRGAPGRRVGLSFGGGGTVPEVRRNHRCIVEHERGTMESNLVMSCSDVGINVTRAAQTRVILNTVIDTAGVLVRFPECDAVAAGNRVDGTILAKDVAGLEDGRNQTSWLSLAYFGIHPVRRLFENPEALGLRCASGDVPFETRGGFEPDLCGAARSNVTTYGAFADFRRRLDHRTSIP